MLLFGFCTKIINDILVKPENISKLLLRGKYKMQAGTRCDESHSIRSSLHFVLSPHLTPDICAAFCVLGHLQNAASIQIVNGGCGFYVAGSRVLNAVGG